MSGASEQLAQACALAQAQPLEFTLQYPPGRDYFRERFRHTLAWERLVAEQTGDLLLYVHVPFCAARCYYCNFAIDLRSQARVHAAYVDAIVTQLARLLPLVRHRPLAGIDIGGGTPTLLDTDLLVCLLDAVAPFRALARVPHPLSIETTPDIAAHHPERLDVLRRGGAD